MLWFAVLLCLLVSFVFSGIEAGILSVNRVRLRHRVNLRDPAALRLDRLLKNPERLLLTVVIVTNLMNIFAITLVAQAFVQWWGNLGYIAALAVFLPFYLFALELFPKSLFRRFPYRALALLSEPLRIADLLLTPILWLGTGVSRLLVPSAEEDLQKLFVAREDFKYLTIESEKAGALTPVERQLIHNVIDFRSITARDLMQPLGEFPSVGQDCTLDELIAASEGGSRERFLMRSEKGEILGMINLFEAILDRGPRTRISAFIRRLTPVPVTEPATRLLRRLRGTRAPVALVMENDEPIGLVFSQAVYRRLISPVAPSAAAS